MLEISEPGSEVQTHTNTHTHTHTHTNTETCSCVSTEKQSVHSLAFLTISHRDLGLS